MNYAFPYLIWYHMRLSLAWRMLGIVGAQVGGMLFIHATVPYSQRGEALAHLFEIGLPLSAALLVAPLLTEERERQTLPLLAVRQSLLTIVALRALLLVLCLLGLGILSVLVVRCLWSSSWQGETLWYAYVPAFAFAACGLLVATLSRNTIAGYIFMVSAWLAGLFFTTAHVQRDSWQLLSPFAWTFHYSQDVIVHSKIFFAAAGVVACCALILVLRRPERLCC